MAASIRRLRAPWSVERRPECFVVIDAEGRRLAYVYFKDERTRSADHTALSEEEARRVAAQIARLPERA